jgi:isopenicillin N synthase-like dioxygenase
MMPLKTIPVIDISSFKNGDATARRRVVESVAQACIEIGFLIISGHGIPSSTIQNVVTTSKKFFALDPKEKGKVARPRPEIIRG